MTTTTIYTDKLVPLKRSIPRCRRMLQLYRLARRTGQLFTILLFGVYYFIITGIWGASL